MLGERVVDEVAVDGGAEVDPEDDAADGAADDVAPVRGAVVGLPLVVEWQDASRLAASRRTGPTATHRRPTSFGRTTRPDP